MAHRKVLSGTRSNARRLRRDQTRAEEILWEELRANRFFGYAFRRQVPFGRFVADFACHEVQLTVEVDGPSHFTSAGRARDAARNLFLDSEGYSVLRVRNDEVLESIEGVLHAIGRFLPRYASDLAPLDTPLPVPPPQGVRERQRRTVRQIAPAGARSVQGTQVLDPIVPSPLVGEGQGEG